MSYSFSVKASNKARAKLEVAAAFAKVIAGQPVHARDEAAVLANANAVIDLLADDDSKDVSVSVNGYVSWSGYDTDPAAVPLSSASVCASASHTVREVVTAS